MILYHFVLQTLCASGIKERKKLFKVVQREPFPSPRPTESLKKRKVLFFHHDGWGGVFHMFRPHLQKATQQTSGPEGEGGTQVPNGYPLPNGHAARNSERQNIGVVNTFEGKKGGAINFKLRN